MFVTQTGRLAGEGERAPIQFVMKRGGAIVTTAQYEKEKIKKISTKRLSNSIFETKIVLMEQ
ncbi:MAG: hypothetical protein IJC29_02695 [Clostridia bacterium]|nr:hypothetical protein [Clostridia bacterium]